MLDPAVSALASSTALGGALVGIDGVGLGGIDVFGGAAVVPVGPEYMR